MTEVVRRASNANAFLTEIAPLLLTDEARHNLMFGILDTLVNDPGFYPEFHLWVVLDGGVAVGAGLMTPPFNLLIAKPARDGALRALARTIAREGVAPPGVSGVLPEAREFARAWSQETGTRLRETLAQRVYRLDRVMPVPAPPGWMRRADGSDRDLLVAWIRAFGREALPHQRSDPERVVDRRIDGGDRSGFFVWEDGRQVSVSGFGGWTPNGIRIGPVYTPPAERRRGYATALVAALSTDLLDHGRRFCFLYTDLGNPTSNHIYQEIGYRPVCDAVEIAFGSGEADGTTP